MPTIIATVTVNDGKVEEAKALFKDLAANSLNNEPGTLEYVVHQRKDNEKAFVVYEKYQSMDSFKEHSANLAKEGKRFAGILTGPPEIVFLDEI